MLFEFIDHKNDVITYSFKDIEALQSKEAKRVFVGDEYLNWFTCKVKATLDPDGTYNKKIDQNFEYIFNFGGCSGEEFYSYSDIEILNSVQIRDLNKEQTLLEFFIKNSGYTPLFKEDLKILIEDVGIDNNTYFKDVFGSGFDIGPGEAQSVFYVVNKNDFKKVCNLRLNINFKKEIKESNYKNNQVNFNLCK